MKVLCDNCSWSMAVENEQDAKDMLALHELVTMEHFFEAEDSVDG